MSCVACGSSNTKYKQFSRLNSLKFNSENREYLIYTPIKRKVEIEVDKEKYKLGEFFLSEDIELSHKRKTNYENSTGFFKLNLSKTPQTILDSRSSIIKKMKLKITEENFKKCLIFHEPPLHYRWAFWYILSTSDQIISEDEYQRLVRSYKKDVDSIVKKDVPRTFSTNKFFGEKIEEVEVGRELLYQVCKALGTYFTEVGYCQGLNFLAAFFLQISGGNQMECVNALASLMTNSRFLLLGLYDSYFPLVSFLKFLFHRKMEKVNKKIEKSLKESMLPDDVWLTKWYISLMTGYLPKYHTARLLDFVLCHDIFALVSFIVALIESNKEFIIGKSMEEINELVSNLDFERKGRFIYLREPDFLIKKAKKYLFKREELLKAFEDFHKEDALYYGKEEFKRYEPHFKDYLLSRNSRQVEFKIFDFAAESVVASVSERFSLRGESGKISFNHIKPIRNLGDEDEISPYDINSSPIQLRNTPSIENTNNESKDKEVLIKINRENGRRRSSNFFQQNERFVDKDKADLFKKRPSAVYVKPKKENQID